jgi:hypothetical protein
LTSLGDDHSFHRVLRAVEALSRGGGFSELHRRHVSLAGVEYGIIDTVITHREVARSEAAA